MTVRPATPATRIRLVTLVVSRSTSRRITSRSSVSRPKVSCAPIDLSGSPPNTVALRAGIVRRPGVSGRRHLFRQDDPIDSAAHERVALAGRRFKPRAVDYGDFATTVANVALFLQLLQNLRDTRTTHPEHD